MSYLITDGKCIPIKTPLDYTKPDILWLENDSEIPDDLARFDLISISFPSFSDGRGFSLARLIRRAGYQGTLRAVGPVLADQYALLRRVGFNEIEIPDSLAMRQDAAHYSTRRDWKGLDYQTILGQRRDLRK